MASGIKSITEMMGVREPAPSDYDKDDVVDWGQARFYIPETQAPIVLAPHQVAPLRYIFRRNEEGRFPFTTVLWSQPKKSGKTTISGLVARWAAETWGRFGEVLFMGNDAEQAKERGYAALKQSVELDPLYVPSKDLLPGLWHVLTAVANCLKTGTKCKAVATDYKGESGANPILTIWTELWGFTDKAAKLFWAEMAPSPTRLNSMRWIETYMGYEGESELLEQLYETCIDNGRQLTAGELGSQHAFEEAPNPDSLVPCWVNETARTFAYYDSGEIARRMPWQRGQRGKEYYDGERATQTPKQMTRLHKNIWVTAESELVPIEMWDALTQQPAPDQPNPVALVPGDRTPLVMGVDAAVSGDCFGLQVVSRHPDPELHTTHVQLRVTKLWIPPGGGKKIDFAPIETWITDFCSKYNVVEIAYDPYQLHQMMTTLQNNKVAWCRPFGQQNERLQGDKLLVDVITQGRIQHDGNQATREHLQNANAKQAKNEDTKLRIVKKSESRKIDLVVSLAMAVKECLRLNL